jgi:cation:H+ antiporter
MVRVAVRSANTRPHGLTAAVSVRPVVEPASILAMSPLTGLLFLVGLVLLVGGAEVMVRGASRLATALGISPLVVGLTVVAFGTSSPELAVGVASAVGGSADIALGNVVGSNIANILLVLGIAALVMPVTSRIRLVRREVPIMIAASFALWLMAAAGDINRLEGLLLLAAIVTYTLYLVRASRRETSAIRAEFSEEYGDGHGPRVILLNLALAVVGLAMLLVGAQWIVDGAVAFATSLGIPEVIVGLTIVAVGTSLPEVATSVLAGIRGHRDIAVGNVVGSCIFNILMVLGASALVSPEPIAVDPAMLTVDLPLMVATALACLPILYTGQLVSRREGALLVSVYGLYLAYLVLVATGSPAAGTFGQVLMLGLVPVAGVTLTVLAFRERAALRATAVDAG